MSINVNGKEALFLHIYKKGNSGVGDPRIAFA